MKNVMGILAMSGTKAFMEAVSGQSESVFCGVGMMEDELWTISEHS